MDLFRELDDAELERLAQEFVELLVPADYPIFQEGEPIAAFYVVKDGSIVVYKDAVGRPMQLLARLEAYDFFGELTLFEHVDSTISARTTVASRILKIHRDALLGFLRDHPGITFKLQMAAAKRHTYHAAAALELGQRSEVRIRVDREVHVRFADGTNAVAILDNLSPGGLSLRHVPASWSEGEEISFEISANSSRLQCAGRVTWIRGDTLGLAFTAPTDEQQREIHGFLRRLFPKPRSKSEAAADAAPRTTLSPQEL